MKAMLLAAGLGTRLKPFTDHHPKALAPVNGRPLLEHNIRYLARFGITEVVVNVHHFAGQIIDLVKAEKGWGSQVSISHEMGPEPLETGGGLYYARPLLVGADPVLIMNADILTSLSLSHLIRHHHAGMLATLAVTNRSSSRVLLFDHEMRLAGWRNNQTGDTRGLNCTEPQETLQQMAFSGIQIVSQTFLQLLRPGRYSTIDTYLEHSGSGLIQGYDHSGDLLLDCGRPASLEQAALLFP